MHLAEVTQSAKCGHDGGDDSKGACIDALLAVVLAAPPEQVMQQDRADHRDSILTRFDTASKNLHVLRPTFYFLK